MIFKYVFFHPSLNLFKVYKGVPKDYVGHNFTAEVLWDVMMGKNPQKGSGKMLNSGSNDNIFIYYSDHGTAGFSALPRGQVLSPKLFEVKYPSLVDV